MVDRIHFGEEVTTEFVSKVLTGMISVWNSHVGEFAREIQVQVGPEVLRQCDAKVTPDLSDEEVAKIQQDAARKLERIMSQIKPCCLDNCGVALFAGFLISSPAAESQIFG